MNLMGNTAMSNIVSIARYRAHSRKAYLLKVQNRLDAFVCALVDRYFDMDLNTLTSHFQAHHSISIPSHAKLLHADDSQEIRTPSMMIDAWDYIDFRELLLEALEVSLGETIKQEMSQHRWLDRRFISSQQILDLCLSRFITAHYTYAVVSPK